MWEELVGFDCIIYKPQRAEERRVEGRGGTESSDHSEMEQPSQLWNDLIFRSWPLPFQSGLGNADGRKCLCVKQVWCLTLSGAVIPRVCLLPTLNPAALLPLLSAAPSAPTSGNATSEKREEQYCVCAPLCTRLAAKQMFGGGILVAGFAPGPRLIPQWLHKHSLGRSEEQISLYMELYGNGIISTPIKVYFSLPLPSCRLFILLLQ